MPIISVVVPVYDVEKYLYDCVDSILTQSFTDLELILVDDGSPDNCPSICDEYEKSDKRVKVIHQKNQGLSAARNAGINVAVGEYITFIDSDDMIHQEYLKMLYDTLIYNGGEVAITRFQLFSNPGDLDLHNSIPTKRNDIVYTNTEACKLLYLENNQYKISIAACGKLFKRSLFCGIRFPEGKLHEDQFTTYKLLYRANRIVVSDTILYFYRKNEDSITQRRFNTKRYDDVQGISEAIAFFEKERQSEVSEAAKMHKEFIIVIYSLKARKSLSYSNVPKKYKRSLRYCREFLENNYGKNYSDFILFQYYPALVKSYAILDRMTLNMKSLFRRN